MLSEFSALALTFLVATILIPFGIAVLLFGFFTKRKKLAWFGFSSIVFAVPVLLVVLFIGAIRGLNTAVNVASNKGGQLMQDLRKQEPRKEDPPKKEPANQPDDTNDTDDVDDKDDRPDASTALRLRMRSLYNRIVKGESTSIIMAREFGEKGVRFGALETRKDAKDGAFTVSVYMIFDQDYADTVRMRALDAQGREMGRVSIALDEKKGAAKYVDFRFDRRLNPEKLKFGVLDAPGFQDPFPGN